MRFLVDAQLPPTLARFLATEGHEAVAVRDVNLQDAEDAVLWEYASRQGLVVITKDEDFAQRVLREGAPPQVLWLRIGNATNPALLAWLEPVLPEALAALHAGNPLVEVI